MADILTLTPQPVRYQTSAGVGMQPVYLALDVGAYDLLSIEAGVVGNDGGVASFTLDLFTAMQLDTDDGWLSVGTSLLTTATTNSWTRVAYQGGFLRYLRWKVSAISGGTAITFFVRGRGMRFVEEAVQGPAMTRPRMMARPAMAATRGNVAQPAWVEPPTTTSTSAPTATTSGVTPPKTPTPVKPSTRVFGRAAMPYGKLTPPRHEPLGPPPKAHPLASGSKKPPWKPL